MLFENFGGLPKKDLSQQRTDALKFKFKLNIATSYWNDEYNKTKRLIDAITSYNGYGWNID